MQLDERPARICLDVPPHVLDRRVLSKSAVQDGVVVEREEQDLVQVQRSADKGVVVVRLGLVTAPVDDCLEIEGDCLGIAVGYTD